jgi:hypothetical protein
VPWPMLGGVQTASERTTRRRNPSSTSDGGKVHHTPLPRVAEGMQSYRSDTSVCVVARGQSLAEGK